MVLKAYKEQTFKANIRFEDDSIKEVVFRLPRNTDYYTSEDGNTNVNTLYTFANMAKPFTTPVQVESENGSILNITTMRELIDLGIRINLDDALVKWVEKRQEIEAEKERLTKKSKSVGNSTSKGTQEVNA